jgi:hypothetical protein
MIFKATWSRAIPMDDTSTTTANHDQTEEDIFTDTVSDEALEVAAGTAMGANTIQLTIACWMPSC